MLLFPVESGALGKWKGNERKIRQLLGSTLAVLSFQATVQGGVKVSGWLWHSFSAKTEHCGAWKLHAPLR